MLNDLKEKHLSIVRLFAHHVVKLPGFIEIPESTMRYIRGKKTVVTIFKEMGLHPRTAAVKNVIDGSILLPPELASIILLYMPLQEDIFDAIEQGDKEAVEKYMSEPGFNVNALCMNGETPLYNAAWIDFTSSGWHGFKDRDFFAQLPYMLLVRGANPNFKGKKQQTPLELAKGITDKSSREVNKIPELEKAMVESQSCCVIS